LGIAAVAVLVVGAMGAAVPTTASAGTAVTPAPQAIPLDGNSTGGTFAGVGALSAGASSRLLDDYPSQQQSQILDYLFSPDYGASLHILKVEIGGDTNSTDGTEPSHMRTPTQVDCNRGYEWNLMEQAKARNPHIKLYALEWGAPGWVGAGARTVWTSQNLTYLLSWLGCARQHGLQIDYLGGWNEAGYNANWYVSLRQALDQNGYANVQIVADDSYDWTSVAASMQSDPAFKQAVDIIGEHYPCAPTSCSTPSSVLATGKPVWASEQGSQPYDTGAPALAQEINRAYVDGRMTSTINWSLVWSAYGSLPYPGDGLMLANTPWSGNYTVGKSIWVMAHTAQFTQPGWRYLDSASTRLQGGGSVVSLRSPSGNDWSSIAETTDVTSPQQVAYQVSGGLSAGPVHVWATNLNSNNPDDWFVRLPDVQPTAGSFTVTLQPGYLYSFTTTTGQHKGTAVAPPAQGLGLPYTDTFGEYPSGSTPTYLSDLGGAFETAPCIGVTGSCLQQMVTQQPVTWWGVDNFPATLIGDPSGWQNYQAQVSALLPQPGYVELVGRALGPNQGLSGYHFRIDNTGQWTLYRADPTGFNSDPQLTTLATGTAAFGLDTWHRLALRLRGDEITPELDGQPLATALDATYQGGQVGLEVSPWVPAQFRDLAVQPQPVSGQGPQLGPITPNPVQIAAPGDSASVATTVSNPGSSLATAVSAQLQVPAGWSANLTTAPPATLMPGQTAPVSWQLRAPASAAPGAYQATADATYQEGGLDWTASKSVPVDLGIVPQNQMTATATSAQDGYPPSNAIDGNPNTLWHTAWSPVRVYPPQSITLDLGNDYNVNGLLYLPRQDGNPNGIITQYNVYVSSDGNTFTQVATGNWALNGTEKNATFAPTSARYVRLEALQAGNGYVSAAEINVEGSLAH
jgi:O-glycosyl hydrolase